MDKAQRKKEERLKREAQALKRRKQSRIWVWTTVVAAVAIIVLAIVFRPEPEDLNFNYETLPTVGQADAPVKLVEFGDFKCTTCKYFNDEIYPKLKTDFIDTGKISLSFMNFTIISPQTDSRTAALAAQAVYHQNNDEFWKFYHAVYENQGAESATWATSDFLVKLAQDKSLKLDFDKLKKDIDDATYKSEVDKHNKIARDNNFTGTPTLILNGKKLSDSQALTYENLKAEIEKALKESPEAPAASSATASASAS
ncbi:DsbA family protein [Cohnella hashimotonis]|uniref:Thioredoxin domain-containing protein n=1 Tax=Cohnella hashimotonis TaxID=2826895 RepID=A0ABT6TID3_9BACL|nr:thioredoxin domain-containing protein [Cohnella hashimotonis]MDI4646592.1 thioredoxin domain-containing protein [Cohnella hashimotonis]